MVILYEISNIQRKPLSKLNYDKNLIIEIIYIFK